ncbi:MAG: translation initiation factor IF-3 [Spirochaetia bacterium]|jgi:translation initiation factor IF-3|nr:translation initiation factor IF-3 [Spirochaetia bacterium]
MAIKDLRINKQIRAKEVFLIDSEGTQKGVMKTYDAIIIAEEVGLDLVEVSPNANPPVCKILDFGKYRYEQEKRLREAKKNQTVIKMKEIRMQPKIERHDLETKSKFIADFLNEGNKVKVSIRFRGRELAHTELGKVVLDKILNELTQMEVEYNMDRRPMMEGKMMSMIISPIRTNKIKRS